ncbi:MAG TPA: 7TM diverse intracellular signaling domain-containing protein, partial [Gammaproteobacteria bacterium]|nr:7TM diverse intracellular signaling domain-containing protein [Gammaproteobacteria bacterium]
MEAEGNDSGVKVFQGMIIGLCLVLVLFSMFLYLNGLRDRTNLYFGLFLIAIATATFLDSLYFYDLSLKTPLVQRVIYALSALAPILLLLLVFTFIGYRLQTWEKLGVTIMAAIGALLLLLSEALEMALPMAFADQMNLINIAWIGMLALSLLTIKSLRASGLSRFQRRYTHHDCRL